MKNEIVTISQIFPQRFKGSSQSLLNKIVSKTPSDTKTVVVSLLISTGKMIC